jgi:hypothetical protein
MGVCRKSHLYQARGWILHTAKRSNRGVKKNYRAKGGKSSRSASSSTKPLHGFYNSRCFLSLS